MPYPESPFATDFNQKIIANLKGQETIDGIQNNINETLKWLCSAPKLTSYRVNTLKSDRKQVIKCIQEQLDRVCGGNKAEYSEQFPEVVLIKHAQKQTQLRRWDKEIIVDVVCAAAVLRGAHIYAPGVLAMVSGTLLGDNVSIYADLSKKCKKGYLKVYKDENKVFIGNGIAKLTRQDLFGTFTENSVTKNLSPKGIAIELTETISGCPPLGDNFIPTGWALLQNLPSIVCVRNLNPQENDLVLDMCAAPGNKTTDIAALMNNKGLVIAIDKTPLKLISLRENCKNFNANVLSFQADSCKILANDSTPCHENHTKGPPFNPETFDRILLDAPCSALGKRPQFSNTTNEKVIKSFVPLQRKLFNTAVTLLKPGGTLVYSTCTITLSENEGIVAWALKEFPSLVLISPEPHVGGTGWQGTTLTEEQRLKVQRFGVEQEYDSVGFFIACFTIKKN